MERYLIFTVCLLLSGGMHSQVTIGLGERPMRGALLDLKEESDGSSTKGLNLPRVLLTSNSDITNGDITGVTAANQDAHIGLLVYNTGEITTSAAARLCPGIHVWDGDRWAPVRPYPAMDDRRTIITKDITSEAGRTDISGTAGYPIGPLGQFTDKRGPSDVEVNQYHHARFYAYRVQATGSVTYEGIKKPYECDDSQAVVELWTETGSLLYVDDGVWMTENLNTEYLTATSPTKMTASAANNYIVPQYSSPTNAGANPAQIVQNGLFYNWAAATNQKGGSNGLGNEDNPGTLIEPHTIHKDRQGICPTGWHLPSDKEYNELEAVYAPSSNKFTLSITQYFAWSYDLATGYRPNDQNDFGHGKSMKSTTSFVTATNGDSKPAANGGFNILLVGYGVNGAVSRYDSFGYLWSSSSNATTLAWMRNVDKSTAGLNRGAVTRYVSLSVRCKKN